MLFCLFALFCVTLAREWTFNGQRHVGKITSKNPGICDPNVQQWAGTYQISAATHKNYFYWAFASRKDPENAPTVLWMTGGPGCSSELALLAENGPCKIDGNLQTTLNPYSWNSFANLVYVDQPADVGFSYSDSTGLDHNETEVAEDMYHFLQDLFQEHQNWLKNDFYIIGESYGGHYVPATAHRVYQGNVKNESVYLPLKGAGIGNGLTNPQIQYQYYGQFAYNYSIERLGHPVVSLDGYKKMQAALPFCLSELKKCTSTTPLACEISYEYCNSAIVSVYSNTGLNPYDFRKPCGSNPLCYDFTNITTWLNLASTQQALGVRPTKWQSCNMQVNQKFATDYMQGFEGQLPDLLNNGIKVMIYVGDCGFICNWIGNKQWTLALPWKGQSGFVSAPDVAWSPKGKEVALARTYGGFTFLQVHDAGHMVPMDQPEVALQILDTFLNSHW